MTGIKAEYIDHMGDDLDVVNSARVSFDKQSEWELTGYGKFPDYTLGDKDKKLIKYLATHDHFTPFTHQVIKLRETVPVSMARQRFKHTVGFTYNETSRRYVSDTPEYFIPDVFHEAPGDIIKQGSGGEHPRSEDWLECYKNSIEQMLFVYEDMVANGVAPEEARLVLPQGVMTSYIVTGSLAAWARAYNLRNDPNAQKLFWVPMCSQWNAIIAPLFPIAWKELTNGS